MAVGIKVDGIIDEIGTADFFHAFFSTISRHLEPEGWGTEFPTLMKELYQGRLAVRDAPVALAELKNARHRLRKIAPEHVVWDIEDPSTRPPWGDDISDDITDLSSYFVTSTGRDLFDTLAEAFKESSRVNKDATIENC